MFKISYVRSLLLTIIVFMFSYTVAKAQAKSMGEPVPGAEVFIELEPDDQPITNGTTNENGEFSFFVIIKPTLTPKPRTIKTSFKFPEKILKSITTKFQKTNQQVSCNFKMVTMVNNKKYEKTFSCEVKKPQEIKSTLMSGPFSQSLSNIEDNMTNPGPKKIPISIKLYLSSVK